ncbi:helix-turn-helix domain-containing protein [Pusillimonas sp.]|uniref:helix-turn-helix domain-containing protein n=1 Tax=Pusillimonas sp. TaxID=3040095 RepID=UPI0037C5E6FD
MTRIAIQVRLMREKAGLSQAELAERIGTKQGAIARLESMAYGKFSMATLHKVADFFDVVAWVEFVPFSTLLARTSDLSAEALTPAAYSEEFGDAKQPRGS